MFTLLWKFTHLSKALGGCIEGRAPSKEFTGLELKVSQNWGFIGIKYGFHGENIIGEIIGPINGKYNIPTYNCL